VSGAWRMLSVMASVPVFYALDRTIPDIVVEPAKQAFRLDDAQLGLLLGLATGFAMLLATRARLASPRQAVRGPFSRCRPASSPRNGVA
jgi:hypothetical protein